MSDITELMLSGGGLTVVATDEMLADVASMAAISAGLDTVRTQLAIADATLSPSSRAMTQVGWARAAMDDAWTAMTTAKDISDYLGDRLVTVIGNYTEAERNATWMAAGVNPFFAFGLGKSLTTIAGMLGPLSGIGAAVLPWFVRAKFEGSDDPIGARDVEVNALINWALIDPQNVATLRRLVMNGDFFAAGVGPLPALAANELARVGLSGETLSSGLLMLYAAQAGMLSETGVTVSKSASFERSAPIGTTVDRIRAIPDPALRPDGAQIRIDEIHDGGTVRYEVFIAGTADFNPISATEPWDFTSNVMGVAGEQPASYRAVQQAMQQAGITATSEVAFVGYSQGGLVASMLAASGDYDTRGVTTIGGPSGQIIIPPGVPALLIEHYEDPVPALGGTQANTDALLVRRHAFSDLRPADLSLPMPGHQLQYYLETAALIDDAESRVLIDTVDQLNDFSTGDRVVSTWYTAERVP